MAKKRSLKFETGIEPRGAAAYFELLAHGLREGRISLTTDVTNSDEVTLDATEPASLRIRARSNARKGRASISIELNWREGERPEITSHELFISSLPAEDADTAVSSPETGPIADAESDNI